MLYQNMLAQKILVFFTGYILANLGQSPLFEKEISSVRPGWSSACAAYYQSTTPTPTPFVTVENAFKPTAGVDDYHPYEDFLDTAIKHPAYWSSEGHWPTCATVLDLDATDLKYEMASFEVVEPNGQHINKTLHQPYYDVDTYVLFDRFDEKVKTEDEKQDDSQSWKVNEDLHAHLAVLEILCTQVIPFTILLSLISLASRRECLQLAQQHLHSIYLISKHALILNYKKRQNCNIWPIFHNEFFEDSSTQLKNAIYKMGQYISYQLEMVVATYNQQDPRRENKDAETSQHSIPSRSGLIFLLGSYFSFATLKLGLYVERTSYQSENTQNDNFNQETKKPVECHATIVAPPPTELPSTDQPKPKLSRKARKRAREQARKHNLN